MIGQISRLLVLSTGFFVSSQALSSWPTKWGYKETTEDELGPEEWKLSYPSCGGTHQSPIDFPMTEISHVEFWGTDRPPLRYGGDCAKFTLKKLEDVYKWEIQNDQHCTVKSVNVHGRDYTLLQFHLHATSEHTVNSYHYDAELHFVHKDISESGKLLVMGIFLRAEEGAEHNRFINNLLGDMASDDETFDLEESELNYADMLNSLVGESHLINYSGSLTTPPCSEIVDWWVLNSPISISFEDLDKIEKLYSELPSTKDASNNRSPQPLNDREITYYYRRPRTEQRCCEEGQAVIADDFKDGLDID